MKSHLFILAVAFALCGGCATSAITKSAVAKPSHDLDAVVKATAEPVSREEAVRRHESARRDVWCEEALKAWKAGDVEACTNRVEQVLQEDAHHRKARSLAADLALERGDAVAAERMLLELHRETPDDPTVTSSLAWLYEEQGRRKEAEKLFHSLGGDEAKSLVPEL